jgi:hypothetical protein
VEAAEEERWCECHLNNGMMCAHFYNSGGYCLHCGHDRDCHGLREERPRCSCSAYVGACGGGDVDCTNPDCPTKKR